MTNDKSGYFNTFCRISQAFGTTRSKEELLELIVDSVIKAMNGKAACLFLADEREDLFVPVAQKGLSANYLHASPMKARRIVNAILKGGYLAFKDATTDQRLENREEKKREGIASILTVPVQVLNKTIGVLSLYTATTRDFSQDEIDFLNALADQGGIAIRQARLLERIRQNSLLFFELAAAINSSLEIKKVLHILTAELCEALNVKGVSIRLLNPGKDTLELVASYGLSERFLNRGNLKQEPVTKRTLQGETLAINDVTTSEEVLYRQQILDEGVASMLCVPIKMREEVIGIMRLCSEVAREYPEDTVLLINALAHQGALAIQNATAHAMLEQDVKDLKEDAWSHRSWF